ncbi:alpha/beta hydrolase [Larsenimonas suaedae]|uniref:Alpha/beta hydrolase-fold protein n=1 Tax=Larsenimonas suaedae TaxID=1851019 RepID=A0ABU1GYN7_9GAMM|nr:alpha/beta hydrolase-fold protein [Larsenimonas suaedae]MCM2971416.1 alpha/beta hydrolase-fold protein [Larsenimonas suaedae]MDR5896672.1 alpha/beta hydrolase-fold protein [Larsenimonas suaedae]
MSLLSGAISVGASQAQAASNADSSSAMSIPDTKTFTLHNASDQAYSIMTYVPDVKAPPGGFPVIYLLDGNATFPIAVEAFRLQQAAAHGGLPAAVIVGIGYPHADPFDMVRRAHDYTPMPAPGERTSVTREGKPVAYGGAERFYRFIEQTLKPTIESRYPINTQRQALFGHSYGALFALTTLFRHPDAFQQYIAASPSLWWGNGVMEQLEQAFTPKAIDATNPVRVLLTVGEYEQALSPSERKEANASEVAARRREHQMTNNAKALAQRLNMLDTKRLSATAIVFPQEYHRTVLLVALNRALHFILSPDAG